MPNWKRGQDGKSSDHSAREAGSKKVRARPSRQEASTESTKAERRRGLRRKAKETTESAEFANARSRAGRILQDSEATKKLSNTAWTRVAAGKGALADVAEEAKTLIRLVRAYARGDYREIAFDNAVLIAAALVYLVTPIDLIPDLLPGGFVDDAAVVLFVVSRLAEELAVFREWEKRNGSVVAVVTEVDGDDGPGLAVVAGP
jgi:uncharacterized membrane protein YkvA (DUF1232 family)